MNTINLTLNYLNIQKWFSFNEKIFGAISLRQKKIIFRTMFVLVLGSVVAYLYLTGAMISANLEFENLKALYKDSLLAANEAETSFIREEFMEKADFFIAQGYEAPKNLEVIKRDFNVAEGTRHILY